MTLHEAFDQSATAATPAASFHDLMASIGYLLFQWSLLDQSIDVEIVSLRQASGDAIGATGRSRTVNERIAEWRALLTRGRRRKAGQDAAIERIGDRIQELQRMRTLVASGFVTASSEAEEPFIRCRHGIARPGMQDEVQFGISDLLHAIEAMESCRSEMVVLRGLDEA